MNRRDVVFRLGAIVGSSLAASFAFAQASGRARIGLLVGATRDTPSFEAVVASVLRPLGWIEGQNLTLHARYADGDLERLPKLADELVALRVQVIVAPSTLVALAARRASRAIPIVIVAATHPVENGLVQTLSRPGGNVTGVIGMDPSFSAKSLQLMKEALPHMKRFALIYTIGDMERYVDEYEREARPLMLELLRIPIRRREDVRDGLLAAKKQQVDALRVSPIGPVSAELNQIVDFAAKNKIPVFFAGPGPIEQGGFMSYGPSPSEFFARSAAMVDKILKGASPADIPMEYPTRYELVVNLQTARQIGITVPGSVLQRADRVIE